MLFYVSGAGDGDFYNDRKTFYIPLHKVDMLVENPKGEDYAVVDGKDYPAAFCGCWGYSIVDIESTEVNEARWAKEAQQELAEIKRTLTKDEIEDLRRFLDEKKGNWMVWKDRMNNLHVYCSNCNYQVPPRCEIPDICPVCHSENIKPERTRKQ